MDTHNDSSFGALLRHLRLAVGLTQEALAERAQLSVRGIKYLEHDGREPYGDTVRRLAEALGLDADTRASFELAARSGAAAAVRNRHRGSDSPGLPRPPYGLIGREVTIAAVRELLGSDAARLVTLTGPGGVGKTALALHVAPELRATFPDGVAFVPLASLVDPSLMLSTIADTLGVGQAAGQPVLARLCTYLRGKRLLLVLDNCEHLRDAVPSLADFLGQCAAVKVLATSRAPLRIRGEREFPVSPLALPDRARLPPPAELAEVPAIALFIDRAMAGRPDFAITPGNAAAVAEICIRLDGLPLAIELVAARIKLLTPQAMLRRMGRLLPLLTDGPRDLPARQRTLRDTIAWSCALLTVPERLLFRRLAVFAGGWTFNGLGAIYEEQGDLPLDLLDCLASLVDQSMVRRDRGDDGEPHFAMLQTIREFALEQLAESGEEADIRDRHARYLAGLAQRAVEHLEGADQATWLDRLARDDDNFRAALAWAHERAYADLGLRLARALNVYWFVRGHLVEGYEQTIRFTRLPESMAFPHLCSDALNAAGFLARESGDYARASAASRESLALSHRLNDRKRAADALANLGYVALQQGEQADARDLFQRSLATNRELGNRQGIADSLSFLALTAFRANDLDAARRMNEESLAIWAALGDRQATVWARTRLAHVLLEQGAHADAYGEFMMSLITARELDFRPGLSWSFDGLAYVASRHGAPRLAARLAAAAASVRERAGIRLSPLEQTENDRLLDRIRAEIGTKMYADTWENHQQWSVDEVISTVQQELGTVTILAGQTPHPCT
ncbi:MAG: tetratricopeptide repeat protein [Chloroflexota bacterium]|nr:tetratricopeptide repeat protein [Chloroflexota bacterium]